MNLYCCTIICSSETLCERLKKYNNNKLIVKSFLIDVVIFQEKWQKKHLVPAKYVSRQLLTVD